MKKIKSEMEPMDFRSFRTPGLEGQRKQSVEEEWEKNGTKDI